MPALDAPMADKILAQLATLPADVTPAWGKMNRAQLYGHLNAVIAYSTGKGPEMPFRGNFKTRNIFRPLAVNGWVRLPRNVRLPRPAGAKETPPPPEATLEEFEATLRNYVARLHDGDLPSRTHPFFGVLNPAEWSRFHWNHFRHHMEQFGVWEK